MPGYDDILGGLPPDAYDAPDPATLQWPWSSPAQPQPPVDQAAADAAVTGMQPGIGVPAAALDAGIAPPPVLGPQPEGAAPPPGAVPTPPPEAAPLTPFGAGPESSPAAGPTPTPFGPTPFGPQPATVGQLPGLDITTERPPNEEAAANAANPLRTVPGPEGTIGSLEPTPAMSDAEAGKLIANLPPEKQAEIRAKLDAAKADDYATKVVAASTRNRIAAQEHADTYARATAAAQKAQGDLDVDAKALANETIHDPRSQWSTFQKIMGFIAVVAGGLVQGKVGGPNIGLQMINDEINQDIERQKANLGNKRAALGQRQGAVNAMFERTGDVYRATETARAAAWESTIQQLQAEQLKYDPHGTTAMRISDTIQQARAQQQQAVNAYGQQQLKNYLEVDKATQEQARNAETQRHNMATEAEAAAKLAAKGGGAGIGSGTNPSYTVPTGWFNPFDPTQPVMGKRAIGGKGEDAKERNTVSAQIATYGHVQDYWAKLGALGDKIGYAKSLGESAWHARRGTLESEYDAAKEALTVYLTKELGDKLTQGQLDAQSRRIPDRASVFEARDPSAQIAAAQSDADRDFARDMNQVGIDATPIITGAQRHRTAVQPTPTQDLDAAQAAAAASPADKDAAAALTAAQGRVQAETAAQQQHQADFAAARALPAPPEPLPEDASRPTGEVAAAKEANRATLRYSQLHQRFMVAAGDTSYRKGLKPGELAAAEAAQDKKLGILARETLDAHTALEQARLKAHQQASQNSLDERAKREGIDPEEARARARVGLDPFGPNPLDAAQAPAATLEPGPNPLLPDRSYVPGADPFGPAASYAPPGAAPPRKKKR